RGLQLAARSARSALAILAYDMRTGRVPFNDDDPMNVLQAHLHAEVPPMPQTIPSSVQQVVRRALEKEPSRRYQSAGEMMQHCQQVFSELNQGQGWMGDGGVRKTLMAGSPPSLGPPRSASAERSGAQLPFPRAAPPPQNVSIGLSEADRPWELARDWTLVANTAYFVWVEVGPSVA